MIIILWAVDIVVVILMMTRVDGAGKAGRGEVGGLLGRGQEVCQEVWEQVFNLFFLMDMDTCETCQVSKTWEGGFGCLALFLTSQDALEVMS